MTFTTHNSDKFYTRRLLIDSDIKAVRDCLLESHLKYEWESWLFPDETQRREKLGDLLKYDLQSSYPRNSMVFMTENQASVLIAIGPERDQPIFPGGQLDEEEIFGNRLRAIENVEKVITAEWKESGMRVDVRLATMGTLPSLQGQGLGSLLIEAFTNFLTQNGLTSSLETSRESNVKLYKRFGYEVTGKIEGKIFDAPNIWLMYRS